MEASNNPDQERQDAPENNQKDTPARPSAGNRQIKRSVQKRKQRSKKRKTPTRRMRKRNVVVLWLVAIGLLISMVISFTPTLGNLTGSQIAENPAFFVNGEAITELQVAQARQNPLFGAVTEGEVADDLELLLVSQLVDNTVLRQAAADTRVTRAEVREAVDEYRVARGVAGRGNDSAYLQLINNQGFTDETFRDFQREQIRQRKFIENLTDGVTVTDSEVEDFYTANQVDYVSDPQIVARQIVVEDENLANNLHARALRGEDFANLASGNSIELAEVSGAIQADDEGNPQPVSRAALPTSVSSAAFGLQGQGITDVVSTGGLFYIVQVLDYLPADVRPFDEITEQVREDALAAKESALLQETLRNLRQDAALEFPDDSEYDFDNEVVAIVGEEEVRALELAEATYLNQQVQQFLSPQNAEIVASFFKPSSLEQLIEQKLALQGADSLDATFVGSEGVIARSALNYVANDAEVTEEDLQTYYEANQDRFTIPASATALQLDFDSEDAAFDFRNLILEENLDLAAVAERASNEALVLTDLGTVEPGQLDSEVDRYLFGTEAFTVITEDSPLEVSDVIIVETTVEETTDDDTLTLEAADTAEAEATDETTAETAEAEATDETTTDATDEAEATSDDAADTAEAADTEAAVADTVTDTDTVADADTVNDVANDVADTVADADTEATDADVTDADITETAETVEADTADASSDESEATTEAVTETTYTLLVAIRTPERVRSLDEVRAQVRETVLNTERSDLQQAWLTALRESIPVENLIAEQPATVPATAPNVEFTTEPAPAVADPEAVETEAVETEAVETEPNEADAASEDTPAEDTATEDAAADEDATTEDTATPADDAEATEAEVIDAETTEAESASEDSSDDAETGETEDSDTGDTNETDDGIDAAPDASEEGDTSTDDTATDDTATDDTDTTTDEPAANEPAEATDADVIEAGVIEAEDTEAEDTEAEDTEAEDTEAEDTEGTDTESTDAESTAPDAEAESTSEPDEDTDTDTP